MHLEDSINAALFNSIFNYRQGLICNIELNKLRKNSIRQVKVKINKMYYLSKEI